MCLSDLHCIIRSRGHFDIYWLVNAAESLLGENRIVIWLCKIPLLQYQPSMYCSVKTHYSLPICSVWRITVQKCICTFSIVQLSHCFHYNVPPQVWLYQQFVFNVIDSVALNSKLKAVSPIICSTTAWLHYCHSALRWTGSCTPTQGKSWCVNSRLK